MTDTNVLQLAPFRVIRQCAHIRKRLIISFKNPLLRLSKEAFQAAKEGQAAQLLQFPNSIEEKIKWQLLHEVEIDRS